MPTMVRQVFILSHYQGRSLHEISKKLGIRETLVASLLRYGNTFLCRGLPNP